MRGFESTSYSKKTSSENVKSVPVHTMGPVKTIDDKKQVDYSKNRTPGDDKLSALKNYRRSKGLCFKCGEKWGPNHKCPATVSLNALEKIWKCLNDTDDSIISQTEHESDSEEDLMAISIQAMNGTEGLKTLRLRGYIQGKEVFMLDDQR